MRVSTLLIFLISLAVAGCDSSDSGNSSSNNSQNTKTIERRNDASARPAEVPDEIRKLGDRIAGLSLEDAAELSSYLEFEHGLTAHGQPSIDNVPEKNYKPAIVMLGKEIVKLSLTDANLLSDYLEVHHGVKPATDN